MADDIVTRLREQADLSEMDIDNAYGLIALTREAADEIDRLRTENAKLLDENDLLRVDIRSFINAVEFLLDGRAPTEDLADLLDSWEC